MNSSMLDGESSRDYEDRKSGDCSSELDLAGMFGESPARLEVDLGCGKGRFLTARAMAHPEVSFLGIDKRLVRVRKAERKAARLGLSNVRLLCAEAGRAITTLLPSCSVSACYLFFPDPWPKRRHHRRRLFSRGFVDGLARTLVWRGKVHVITDDDEYFAVIYDVLASDTRFGEKPAFVPVEEECTEFQLVFQAQNKPLHACSFEKRG